MYPKSSGEIIQVTQFLVKLIRVYSITQEGRIDQKLLSNEKGNIEWDTVNQKKIIVKDK